MRTCLWFVIGSQMLTSAIEILSGLAGTVSEKRQRGAADVFFGCLLLALCGFSAYALWFQL